MWVLAFPSEEVRSRTSQKISEPKIISTWYQIVTPLKISKILIEIIKVANWEAATVNKRNS